MKPKFKLAVVQIRTEADKAQTMDKADRMIAEAASNGAELVVLPEMWNCPYSKKYFHAIADNDNGESRDAMSRWAKESGCGPERGRASSGGRLRPRSSSRTSSRGVLPQARD